MSNKHETREQYMQHSPLGIRSAKAKYGCTTGSRLQCGAVGAVDEIELRPLGSGLRTACGGAVVCIVYAEHPRCHLTGEARTHTTLYIHWTSAVRAQ